MVLSVCFISVRKHSAKLFTLSQAERMLVVSFRVMPVEFS